MSQRRVESLRSGQLCRGEGTSFSHIATLAVSLANWG